MESPSTLPMPWIVRTIASPTGSCAWGVGFQVTLQRRQLPVVVLDEGQIHRNGAAHLWLGEVLEQPRALRGPRGPNAQRGQVVLVIGVRDMREQLGARAQEVMSAAHAIPGFG